MKLSTVLDVFKGKNRTTFFEIMQYWMPSEAFGNDFWL